MAISLPVALWEQILHTAPDAWDAVILLNPFTLLSEGGVN